MSPATRRPRTITTKGENQPLLKRMGKKALRTEIEFCRLRVLWAQGEHRSGRMDFATLRAQSVRWLARRHEAERLVA